MLTMDKINDIRFRFFVKGENISQIADVLQLDWKTVQKYVDKTDFNEPAPQPASEQRFCPKLEPYDSRDGVGDAYYHGRKSAVGVGSHHSIARQKAMDGEDNLKTPDELQEAGTTPVPATEARSSELMVLFGRAKSTSLPQTPLCRLF